MGVEVCGCGYEGGAGAGFHLQDHNLLHHRQRQTRGCRMAQVISAVLLVLVSALVATVIVVTFKRQCSTPPHIQITQQPDSHTSDEKPQQSKTSSDRDKLSRALLTAHDGNISNAKYLQWEPQRGNAYCEGFNCSSGEVVILRDGYYRVTLQVTYEGDPEKPRPDTIILILSVLYSRPSHPVEKYLLSSLDTVTNNKGIWIKSLHTSGSFRLETGGILRVTSTEKDLISKKEDRMLFGVELLPDT